MPEPAQRLLGYRIALGRRLDDVARAQVAVLGELAARSGAASSRPRQGFRDQAGAPPGPAASADSSS
jgi:hypothetical protein